MPSPSSVIRGFVQKLLPSIQSDSTDVDVALRLLAYKELAVAALVRKGHLLADEGVYFTANNAQTGVTITTTAAFAAVSPFITIYNGNLAGGKSIYLDYASLTTTTAGSAASGLTTIQAVVVMDNGNRYSSAGTTLTPKNVNMAVNATSGAIINAGQVVATAASGVVRTIVGLRTLRPCVSGTVADVVGETKVLNFGGVEGGSAGSITVANANIIPVSLPPIIVSPGSTALIYVFYAASGTPVAAAYAPEIGYWER